MKCWLCLRVYDGLSQLNQHVRKDHPVNLNEEQTYAKVCRLPSTTNLREPMFLR
jgi:hypothetical protein